MRPATKRIITSQVFSPPQLPGLQAWYDLSDPSYVSTTTALFTGTGTATSTLISTAFVGVGTAFLSELAQGDTVYNSGNTLIGTIASVTDDTNAVLTAVGAAAITGAAWKVQKANPRIILIGDKSGNSNTNVLALNGVVGNYASTPSAAANQPGDNFELIFQIAANDYSPAAVTYLCAKRSAGAVGNTTFYATIETSGKLLLGISDGTSIIQPLSTVALPTTDLTETWVKITYQRDTGGGNYAVNFYTGPDGVNYSQLGATVAAAATGATRAGTEILELGSVTTGASSMFAGLIKYFSLAKSIGGVPTTIFSPGTAAKLASSFVASTSETWTINTSGGLGARICGARDLVQLTAGKQPTWVGANSALFDGANDYMKAAQFQLVQPETVYFTGTQVTWTLNDYFFDGASGANNLVGMRQSATTPNIRFVGGSAVCETAGPVLGAMGVITSVINATASALRLNHGTPALGDVNAGPGINGITLAVRGDLTTGFGNIIANEILIYSIAHDQGLQDRPISYSGRKWLIPAAM